MGFLKFLFITVLVFWFAGLVLRAVFARFLRKNAEAFQKAQRQAQRGAAKKKTGEITVEKQAEQEKKVKEKVGEYVDFQEIP